MIGDMLMIYDPDTDMFFAGRKKCVRIYADKLNPPIWVHDPADAKRSSALSRYRQICEEIGRNVRIVSETAAQRIVMMREYREGRDGQV